ncbi:Dynein heavy chain 12, axonemal [Pelomyxa schiedti]|nr:Dynein heavy chain 12, axonemal [Pelomyxa schiedti]
MATRWMLWVGYAVVLVIMGNVMVASGSVETRTTEDTPSPWMEPDACHVPQGSHVCNPHAVLSGIGIDAVNAWAEKIQTEVMSNCGSGKAGYELGVLVVSAMEPAPRNAIEQAALVSNRIMDKWGVGNKDCNNGVLLFVSIQDRVIHISTGAGAKKVMTENAIDAVFELARPLLKAEKYDEAVAVAAWKIHEILLKGKSNFFDKWGWVIIGFFVVIALIKFFMPSDYSRCHRHLERLERDRETALKKAERFAATSCPICLEDFKPTSQSEILICGHKFCKSCITRWTQTNRGCPICRTDVNTGEAPNTKSEAEHMVDQEVAFRLNSIHMRYPRIINTALLNTWTTNPRASFTTDPVFQAINAPASSGSSSSFGGGGSYGGGGHGSSW